MNHIILLLVFCLLSIQGTVPKPKSDREQDGFVGPVKKVSVTWTPISGSSYPPGSKCRQLTNEYDQPGRLTRHSVYPGSCGSDEIREDYTYSADGNRNTKVQEIRGADSPEPPPPAANPDAKKENGPPKHAPRYDDSGRLVEDALVWPSGKYIYRNAYTYDAKGRLIETTGYDGDNQLTDRRVYTYSGDERVPSVFVYYDRDGKIRLRTTYTDYKFNSKGDWTERKQTTDETPNRHSVSMFHREIEYYYPNNQ